MTELEAEKHILDEAVDENAKRFKVDTEEVSGDAPSVAEDNADVGEGAASVEPASAEPASASAEPEPEAVSAEPKEEPKEDSHADTHGDPNGDAKEDVSMNEVPEEVPEAKPEPEQSEPVVDESQMTPLERAERAAERARLVMPEDLDPATVGDELPKHQHRYFVSAIKAIKRLKDAQPFLAPVDPVKQGVPDYFTYIKEPMDLGTIEKNLAGTVYTSVQAIVDDFNRVVYNCIYFNGEEAGIAVMAKSIAQSFKKHLLNAPVYDENEAKRRRSAPPAARFAAAASAVVDAPRTSASPPGEKQHLQAPGVPVIRRSSMTADGRPKRAIHPPAYRQVRDAPPKTKLQLAELKFCANILRELTNRKNETFSYPFLQPVDPVAQGVPNYFEVIKKPMDLSTISTKLNEGLYEGADDFEADIRLMFHNCYIFNPEGTPVAQLGHRLEGLFDRRWLEKPQAVNTPPNGMYDADSEIDEYEEAGITNPAIKVLEDNINNLKQQLRKLKREALASWREKGGKRKSKAAGGGAGGPGRRSSTARNKKDEPLGPMTYAMKKEISEKIPTLPEKKLRKVLAIIQESMPHLKNNGQEEIELDMDQLDESTQQQLYNYVVRKMEDNYNSANSNNSSASTPGAGAGAPQKKKKSKPLTEDEQNRQIEEIQQKLAQFDSHKPGSTPQVSPAVAAPDDDSSSDEDRQQSDSDDSSSEEE